MDDEIKAQRSVGDCPSIQGYPLYGGDSETIVLGRIRQKFSNTLLLVLIKKINFSLRYVWSYL